MAACCIALPGAPEPSQRLIRGVCPLMLRCMQACMNAGLYVYMYACMHARAHTYARITRLWGGRDACMFGCIASTG